VSYQYRVNSPAIPQILEDEFDACELLRPFRRACYDPGHRLDYEVTGVVPANRGRVRAEVERAVGGGFAGQVYRIRLLDVADGLAGLQAGQSYALKILTPPSRFARAFRNALFAVGYQAPFAAQVNPASVRVGVLWQKLIRRGMALASGRHDAVCDTYATLFDSELHSHGEINEWIDGRLWKFEVDDRLFSRWGFEGAPPADHSTPEYVHKRLFMRQLVALLHDMGAPELARQYEWWTLKSQPNVLKRHAAGDDPAAGLTAVDFRAGLTLLPFLPMSPADLWLIMRGMLTGRVVQFDRSSPRRFDAWVEKHRDRLEDLEPVIAELREQEAIHRDSLPDIAYHGVRTFGPRLQRTIRSGAVTAWKHLGFLDDRQAARLDRSWLAFFFWHLVAHIPFLGGRLFELWGQPTTRAHLGRCLRHPGYLWRAMRGARIEVLVGWHRQGRLDDERARRLVRQPVRYWLHRLGLAWLPAGLHRTLSDGRWAWQRLREGVRFGWRMLREPSFREEWLLEQVRAGQREGMLTAAEADRVEQEIKDPYMQKYLKCLAVHVCTVPVTQITMVIVGVAVGTWAYSVKGMGWGESVATGTAAGAILQLSPISPGSMARGLFVLFLMIKERDIRNYYVAAPVAFIHVVGYLAFPLQMVTKNAGLARFMAGRWATSLVHVVPVFGERGAWLEHAIFDLFFNLPLSVKRGFRVRPVAWTAAAAVFAGILFLATLLGVARLWEWRQPPVRLEAVTVSSVTPYYQSGDLHWSLEGVRVHLAGHEVPPGPVDYPGSAWDARVQPQDRVDVVIRRSFFGDEWDGLAVEKRPSQN
jgi:hypothetical protein